MKIQINGDKWTAEVVSKGEMVLQAEDENTVALCMVPERKIIFLAESLTETYVRHEVGHAYWSYLYLDHTTNIDIEDLEEIAVTFFSAKGSSILKTSDEILRGL